MKHDESVIIVIDKLTKKVTEMPLLYYPTIIISDTHLGKRTAQADMLLEFLENTICDKLIINGDFIDGWHLEKKNGKPFDEMHARVLDAINKKASTGTEVICIAGNHDEKVRKLVENPDGTYTQPLLDKYYFFETESGLERSRFFLTDFHEHFDKKGNKFLILHGDQFDPEGLKTRFGKKIARVGDALYDGMIHINAIGIRLFKVFGQHFSLAQYAKSKTKNTLGVISDFENSVTRSVADKNAQGIICGHIHHADIRDMNGVTYMNSGDWVESCSALAEDSDSHWTIIEWEKTRKILSLQALPTIHDENPNIKYRDMTVQQLRYIEKLWPTKGSISALDQYWKDKGGTDDYLSLLKPNNSPQGA